MQIPAQDVQNIREQTDIVSLIEHYVPLEKKGKEFVGVCPFHDDHSPSMRVSPDKQIYKCFSCGAGGDAFKFLQEIEHISYPEAIAKAASLINYPLKLTRNVAPKPADPNQSLYETLRLFTAYTTYELFSRDGQTALQYLQERHFSRDLLDLFEIGYVPSKQMTAEYLEHRIGKQQDLEKTGLIQIGTEKLVPVFFDRITIPIHDANGKPVGYTARCMPGANTAKYINTTHTPLYDKGSLIFNYHRAKDAARKAGRVILCEGAMDVLGLAKAGLMEGIACLGTAMTPVQLQMIDELRVPVTVFYDQDEAGRKAAWNFAQKAREAGIRFSIVANAPRKDPDEVFGAYGQEGVLNAVESTISYAQFAFDYLESVYNLNNYEDKKAYAREMERIIRSSLERFEWDTAFDRLKEKTGFSFNEDVQQPPRTGGKGTWKPRKNVQKNTPGILPPVTRGRVQAEKAVLWAMLFHENYLARFQEEVGYFSNPACSRLSLYLLHAYTTSEQIDPSVLYEQVEEPDARDLLVELSEWPDYSDLLPQYFDDAVAKIQYDMMSHKLDSITRKIAQTNSPEEKLALTREKTAVYLERARLHHRKET